MNINNVKDIIKKRRIELGLTMAEVASAVGVSEATVSRWESGNIANMKRSRIASLAKILKISPTIIMGYDENDSYKYDRYGKSIRLARKSKGMSQEELANAIGIDVITLDSWEIGLTQPDANTFGMIACTLDTTMDDLLEIEKAFTDTSSLLSYHISKLNEKGKEEAVKRIKELTKLDEYTI